MYNKTDIAKKFLGPLLLAALAALVACGGGGGSSTTASSPNPAVQRLVGEIIATPAQATVSDLKVNAGYAGNLPASYAIQNAGNAPLLDILFVRGPDAEARLIAYAQANAALLKPGTRVLVADEVFWRPGEQAPDTEAVLQPQLDALRAAIALVRKVLPQAKVGITVTPYAAIGRPNTLEYSKRAIALADWVGTDPYWLGGDNVALLHDWSRTFHAVAKAANPTVETWYIAQAFKLPDWNTATYNAFIKQQLVYAEGYDHILFFGWQFVSEIDASTAGMHFTGDTRALYSAYLKPR